jgi:hypothetical protein
LKPSIDLIQFLFNDHSAFRFCILLYPLIIPESHYFCRRTKFHLSPVHEMSLFLYVVHTWNLDTENDTIQSITTWRPVEYKSNLDKTAAHHASCSAILCDQIEEKLDEIGVKIEQSHDNDDINSSSSSSLDNRAFPV